MKLKSSRLLAVSLCVGVAILSSCVDNEKNLFDAEQTFCSFFPQNRSKYQYYSYLCRAI